MTNETTLTVRGRVGSVPSLRGNEQGDHWTWFRLASTRSYRREGAWEQERSLWLTVRASGALAERVSELVRTGMPLLVRGRLCDDSWTDREGRVHAGVCLRADAVGVDIGTRGRITYVPPRREDGDPPRSAGSEAPDPAAAPQDEPEPAHALVSEAGREGSLGLPRPGVYVHDGAAYDGVGRLAADLDVGTVDGVEAEDAVDVSDLVEVGPGSASV